MVRGWLTVLFLLLASAGAAVRYDMSKAELLQELGKPVSVLRRGDREILIYPNNVRIEIEQGKVVVVKGLDLAAQETAPTPAAAPTEEVAPTEAEPAEPKLSPEEQKAQAEAEAKLEKALAESDTKARAEMEKAITDLETLGESAEHRPEPSFNLTGFFTELFIKWALMLAALKLTCKYWGADVDWSGLMIAAAADTAVRAIVGVIGYVVLEMFTLLYADEALAAIVLVLVLRKVSTNQSLQQAVTITMTSKVFSIVVGSFLTVLILNALH
ncbi:hypothetical protein ESB00_19310 [Oleiharenicola lentus]|jgi:hypothetical protein|uniref:Uncharacterized protein n=1 Tax=Oleiharenicola lentus TaxID=2508720 RepID=A0A4Q1C5U7_9BACT|nr:hypothetical protein [Oleiharenicola lentus]RXK53832.1 hypothetical protein ESB00_19310 [Oleiharenicola lentus]